MLEIQGSKSEWLVSKVGTTSICASVENGEVKRIEINGLESKSVTLHPGPYSGAHQLRELYLAIDEIVDAINDAIVRTGISDGNEE